MNLNLLDTVSQNSLFYQFTERKKECESIITLFQEISHLQNTYSYNLENITNQFAFGQLSGSLNEAWSAMNKYFLNKAHQSQQFAENLESDVIPPLQMMLKNYNYSLKKLYGDCNKISKEKQRQLEEAENSKLKYWKTCSNCEQILLKLDPNNDPSKIISNKSKKEVEKQLKLYIDTIENYNSLTSACYEASSKFAKELQIENSNLFDSYKDALTKFIVYETSSLRNLQYDIETFSHIIQNIELKDTNLELLTIDSSSENSQELFYEPYSGSHPFFKSIATKEKITKNFQLEGLGKIGSLYKRDLDKILNKAYQGIKLNADDYQQFNCIIKENVGRKCWCLCMNGYKNKGSVVLAEEGFLLVAELLSSFLNECEREGDLLSIKESLNFLQCFYKENSDGKVFLKENLCSHSLWENLELWNSLIQFSIENEMKDCQKYIKKDKDTSLHIENVAFCQLGSFCDTMQAFHIKFSRIKRLIMRLSKKYKIPSKDLQILLANIDPEIDVTQSLEHEKTQEVFRGIPIWLKVIEGAATALSKRSTNKNPKGPLKLSPPRLDRTGESKTPDVFNFEDRRSL